MNIKAYKQYARERRKKSKLACAYDAGMKYILQHDLPFGMNGGVASDAYGNPYSYDCTVGNGYKDESGKVWFTSNMYKILFLSGNKGVTIYHSRNGSLHYDCFTCGGCIEPFGKNFCFKGCRVYENLEVDTILSILVNKDIRRFKNVKHDNPYNLQFLKMMQKRLIKALEHNKIIHWCEEQNQYIDYKIYQMFYKKC